MDVGNVIEQTKCDIVLLYGKLRRLCLTTLAGRRARQRTSRRTGECKQCGTCCKFVFRCPLLDENGLCKIYHSRLRPEVCRRFPIDRRDVEEVRLSSGRTCGYGFESSRDRRRRLH
ncbi:MAG: YkgJ family cysteine cluster protein [Desulfobacterales bacterium]|nr:YkgJ family cysteine cluster protein [Desulfobacterales bacterium]MBS3756596.1 YkgJ family cysteine cluster protein [Desulfobacterales bacterium]